jgi:uncharacterized OsmC-like protein
MSQTSYSHHATIRLAREYEFVGEFPDVTGSPSILFDEPEPLGHNRGPSAAAVLGAAIGNCLAASLTFCLRRARMEVQDMTAEVTTHIAKNEHGRFRVREIEVELTPVLGAANGTPLDRCEELFEDFCIVTESVRRGIQVRVSVKGVDATSTHAA